MLSILGIVIIIVTTYLAYKTARDTGRNPVVWALLTFAVGFGIQIVIPFTMGIVIAVIWISSGTSVEQVQQSIQSWEITITIVCLILSFVGAALILRHISKIPQENSFVAPPPPPDFGGNVS